MKKIILVLLAMVVLTGCDVIQEHKSLKAKNQELEQRIKELEQRVIELEQASSKVKQDDLQLELCLERAKSRREDNLKRNDDGTGKKGGYSMPLQVMEFIQRTYRDDCEECYKRYGRR